MSLCITHNVYPLLYGLKKKEEVNPLLQAPLHHWCVWFRTKDGMKHKSGCHCCRATSWESVPCSFWGTSSLAELLITYCTPYTVWMSLNSSRTSLLSVSTLFLSFYCAVHMSPYSSAICTPHSDWTLCWCKCMCSQSCKMAERQKW